MNILLIGAGAVGIAIAASVASQGADVSIYARGDTAKAIKENGIKRIGLSENLEIRDIPVFEDYNEIPKDTFDYIFIASKITANEDIANNLNSHKDIFKNNTKLIIFQNGFGNDETYLKYFTKKHVYCARILGCFMRDERNTSNITCFLGPMLLGSLQNESGKNLEEIADLLTASGFPCEVTDELDKYLWAKMLYTCALNPLGAVLDCTCGELTENPYSVDIINNIIDEIFNVIKASPYETLWQNSEEYKKVFYSRLVPETYDHYSSTHADVKNKKKTEIDSFNGKIFRLGEKYDVNVDTNKFVYYLIKSLETKFKN